MSDPQTNPNRRPLRPPNQHEWQEYMDGIVRCAACGQSQQARGQPCQGAGKVTIDADPNSAPQIRDGGIGIDWHHPRAGGSGQMTHHPTTEALLFLARSQEAAAARHVEELERAARLRWWQFGSGWRSYAAVVLPKARAHLTELRRHVVNLENALGK